jgi:Uma2 family endonuclease
MAITAPRPTTATGTERSPTELRRRRFSLDEYRLMGEIGILSEDERVELIRGEIVAMSPIGGPHLTAIQALTHHLVPLVGDRVRVSVQNPIRLPGDSEPQPDLSLVRKARYRVPPEVGDVFLVIEVADTTIENDRTVKLPLYAAAGVPEAWLFDLNGARIERHTEPGPTGYQRVTPAERGQSLTSTVLQQVTLSIDDVLELEE